jgi:hypothetical protein
MPVQHLVPHLSRALLAALAGAAGVFAASPALAAEPCIRFDIRAVAVEDKVAFAPGASSFTIMRDHMRLNLERIREQAARVFGETKLAVAFECPPGRAIIGTAEGTVVPSKASGQLFQGTFRLAGNPWNPKLKNQWSLIVDFENAECDTPDELIAISNALVDHRKSNRVGISSRTLGALQGYLQRTCGIRGSASFRQLKDRLDLLRSS